MEGQGTSSKNGQEKIVFISYASEDYDEARRLYEELKNANLDPWLDKESLLPGQDREIEIKKAIKNSTYLRLKCCATLQASCIVQQE